MTEPSTRFYLALDQNRKILIGASIRNSQDSNGGSTRNRKTKGRYYLEVGQHFQEQVQASLGNVALGVTEGPDYGVHHQFQLLASATEYQIHMPRTPKKRWIEKK